MSTKKLFAALVALALVSCAFFLVPPPRVARAQFIGQQTFAGTTGGIANAYTITLANLSSYADIKGVPITIVPNAANTSPTSITFNSLGAVQIFRPSSLGLVSLGGNELKTGIPSTIMYDGTNFSIVSPIDMTPIGQAIEIRGSAAPGGYLIEDGSCYAQTQYAALFSIVGTAYGSCSAGNFAVPDSRGTLFAATDTQGVNGAANRITNAGSGCTATAVPFACGTQNKTVTTSFLPASGLSVPGLSIPGLSIPSLSVSTNTSNVGNIPLSSGAVSSLQTQGTATTNITPANTSGTWTSTTSLAGTGTTTASTTGTGTTGTGITGNLGSGTAMPILNPVLGGLRVIKY